MAFNRLHFIFVLSLPAYCLANLFKQKRSIFIILLSAGSSMQPNNEKIIAVLCNSLAGSGRSVIIAEKIVGALSEKKIVHTLFKALWPDHFSDFTDVFIVGGDGTLNYFINHYPAIELPLVIFKGGTGNDFHWLLYGNKTFDELLQIALYANAKPIDMGRCNERYFINGVGIGFEGEVAKALAGKKKLAGKTSFLITILKKIISYRSKYYAIQSGERHLTGKMLLIDISNGCRAGGGFYIAPEARADDGLLDVVISDALTSFQRLRNLPIIEKGKHLNLPFIHYYCTNKIVIESDRLIQYHLDGEYLEAQKLAIEILPAKLNFKC